MKCHHQHSTIHRRKIFSVWRMPDNMGKVFFTNGGAGANENAIKMARMFTGRDKIFSRYRSYHGSTFGAGNLTGEPRRYQLEPGIPGFVKFFDPYLYREKISFESEEAAAGYYVGKVLGKKLEEFKEKHICVGDVRYIGLFSAIELVKSKETKEPLVSYGCDPMGVMKNIIKRLSQKGFMTYSHENIIIVAPPLIITAEQIIEELQKLDYVLYEVDREQNNQECREVSYL